MPTQSKSDEFEIGERFAIGVAAASGLVTAACISGLPSASCTAMVATYTTAITSFGGSAFYGLASLGLILFSRLILLIFNRLRISPARWPARRMQGLALFSRLFGYVVLLFACCIFAGATLAGAINVKDSTKHCFFGTDAELASRVHQKITLAGPLDWAIIFDAAIASWKAK